MRAASAAMVQRDSDSAAVFALSVPWRVSCLRRTESPMAISGLVITLDDDPERRRAALAALRADERLTLGEPTGNHLPLIAETRRAREGVELIEDLFTQPGVRFVDVVSVDMSDELEDGDPASADSVGDPSHEEG